MNEIILAGNTELGKSVLGRRTDKIINLINAQIRDEKQIAVGVAEVDREELTVKAGFETTAKWAEHFFGFSKSKVSRYISIVKRFKYTKITDEQGRDYWDIFTLGQMQEMINATDEQLMNITPDMTVKAIREYLSMIDVKDTCETADEPDTTPDTGDAEPENTEPEKTPVDYEEYDDITVMLSVIKKYVIDNENAPVAVVRVGDAFRVKIIK